tara:strand:+ start:72 stop:224 length:153 start_codon:yes stop_codon:yes gene_type:complete
MKLRSSETVKKEFIQKKKNPKHTNIWSWDETPEVRKALEVLHAHKEQGKE